jgi:hypothetical protein
LVATIDQISQTENPMFSATIDQIKLRRATNLPVEFQNVSSSGLQSEIQIVLFGFCSLTQISFLRSMAARQTPERQTAAMTTGRAGARRGDPSPTDVADRMIGFRTTASMASASAIQASCQALKT